jgi:hypothetical protein
VGVFSDKLMCAFDIQDLPENKKVADFDHSAHHAAVVVIVRIF